MHPLLFLCAALLLFFFSRRISDAWFALLWRLIGSSIDRALRGVKRSLLADVRGDVLELGAGTGSSLPYLPASLSSLTLLEPNADMHASLRAAIAATPHLRTTRTSILGCGGESIPLPDASFDTVICVLTLCSVTDPAAVVSEARRLLRRGGVLLLLEHVRSHASACTRFVQRAGDATLVYGWLCGGCHLDRDTLATVAAVGGWASVEMSDSTRAHTFPLPLVWGCATRA